MSIPVPTSILTLDQGKYLRKELTITPIDNNPARYRAGYQGQSIPLQSSTVCYLYRQVEEVETLYLPFQFATNFTGINNDCRPHHTCKISFTGQLREDQKPYFNTTINHLNTYRTAILNMRPGFGKTTISMAISACMGYLTLVLVHDSNQIIQWSKAYQLRTDAKVWMVDKQAPPDQVEVIICLYTRATKIATTIRDKVGFLIIDEVHQFNNRTGIESILSFSPRYILASTATFDKSNKMHLVTQRVVGQRKVRSDEVIPFCVIKIETGISATREKTKQGMTNWPKLNQSLLYNDRRNEIIIQAIHMLVNRQRKILVFTNEVKHVRLLHKLISDSGLDSVDYITGNKSQYFDSTILVGNTQKCGTGFDEEMFCQDFNGERINTVLICGSFKNQELLYQVVGRAFRSKDPLVAHLVDNDTTIKSHWRSCQQWYNQNGGSITRVKHNQLPPVTPRKPRLILVPDDQDTS